MHAHPSISQIEEEIVEEFSLFDNWEDKYEYIIEMGKKLPPLDEMHKTEDNKIRGCQSAVWMVSSYSEGRVHYNADSDAMIVKGLISLLVRVLSGQKAEDIRSAELKFIEKIDMSSHLAQTRSNGLRAMVKQMKLDATVWAMKEQGNQG
jgi:cysteine desulfuration protein SufE